MTRLSEPPPLLLVDLADGLSAPVYSVDAVQTTAAASRSIGRRRLLGCCLVFVQTDGVLTVGD